MGCCQILCLANQNAFERGRNLERLWRVLNQCSLFLICQQWITQPNALKTSTEKGHDMITISSNWMAKQFVLPLPRTWSQIQRAQANILSKELGRNPSGLFLHCTAILFIGFQSKHIRPKCLQGISSQDPAFSRSETTFSFSVYAFIQCVKGISSQAFFVVKLMFTLT